MDIFIIIDRTRANVADHYLLFDFPGQVELFFLHQNAKRVIMKIIKKLNLRVYIFFIHLL